MKLGILGGTFDPIHYAHLRIAEAAREHLELDRVMFVPVGAPVHREHPPRAGREHRYAMCLVATESHPQFTVNRIETENPEPSYTVDTLARIHAERPEADLYLIMGADETLVFPSWREPRRILEMARLIVASRPGSRFADQLRCLPDWVTARMHVLPALHIDISATDIRARLAEGRSARYLTPDEVISHIEKYELYR